ncbi:MAG: VanW family protein [Deltaproteobacteria bacterium]|nr:VanW family protein [Deltaproteobacteria bacterium]
MQFADKIARPLVPGLTSRRALRALALLPSLVTAALLVAAPFLYLGSLAEDAPLLPGLQLGGVTPSTGNLSPAVAAYLDQTVAITAGEQRLETTRRALGTKLDLEATRRTLQRLGRRGLPLDDLFQRLRIMLFGLDISPVIVAVDPSASAKLVRQLKTRVDRPAIAAHLDLSAGRVIRSLPGRRLGVFDGVAALQAALLLGQRQIDLPVEQLKAEDPMRLEQIEIGHVLGRFETIYSLKQPDRDRAHNLKVGAARLDGHVIGPGERFSFNEVVGARTLEDGYRTAAVISQGELVDGPAGGACQLSSTLFAAAFFAGLELDSSRPHSIPSGYIKMGLDATVVYPSVDLVVRNPFPFAVVVHMRVSRGKVIAEIRGRQRPFKRVFFERQIKQRLPFEEVYRDDLTIPRGQQEIAQRGIAGYVIERRRILIALDGTRRVERRELRYPPTVQIVRRGKGPARADYSPPARPAPYGNPPETLRLSQ